MFNNNKYLFGVLILIIFSTLSLYAHRDVKNIEEGVINPSHCEKHNNDSHNNNCTIAYGSKGFYILSPARRYNIRKEDNKKLLSFLKKYRTRKVKVKLLIFIRKNNIELWKIARLNKR